MALFLRTTDKDGKSHGGFQWPLEVGAIVTAPDWDATPKCGNGLHGLLNGEGEVSHLSDTPDAIWWIVEADDAIDLGGKHKFQSCKVVSFGRREEVTPQLRKMTGGAVHYLTETGGDYATLTGGDGATLTGGDYATLIFLRWIGGRRRVLTAYVGEDGIEPGKAYRASNHHKSVVPA
jgi:hypothetical protein